METPTQEFLGAVCAAATGVRVKGLADINNWPAGLLSEKYAVLTSLLQDMLPFKDSRLPSCIFVTLEGTFLMQRSQMQRQFEGSPSR